MEGSSPRVRRLLLLWPSRRTLFHRIQPLAPETFDDFQRGNAALQVLVLGQLFNVVSGVTVNALLMTKHERPAVLACAAGLCINVVLCALLIPSWDALGAAVATAASLAVVNVFLVIQVIRKLGVSPAPWFKPLARGR